MPLPADGQVLVKSAYWSVDPYMRGRITGVRTYADPVNIGDVMQGGAVGQVVQSKAAGLSPRDFVAGMWGWQEFATADAKSLRKLEAFNYKSTSDYSAKLKELCPHGIDCYFDNVGGAISDAVFPLMNVFGRISVCGQISQYNLEKPEPGPRLLSLVLVKQLRVEGFIVSRFQNRFAEGLPQMALWLRAGRLKYREEVVEGFENMAKAFIGMLHGDNTGKMLVRA
jgi:NADPH-dependent curcumin reductase CurA